MRTHSLLIHFILSYTLGSIACITTISLTVWALFQRFDSATYTAITLISLMLISLLMRHCSYLLDLYSRRKTVIVCNILLAILGCATVVLPQTWMLLVLYFFCKLYFAIYFTARNASMQNLKSLRVQHLSATLEVTDQLSSIAASGLVVWLFSMIGFDALLLIGCLFSLLSSLLLLHLSIPNAARKQATPPDTHETKKGLTWYFQKPIAWLVTLTIFPNLVVLLSNTVNPIYLYDVLKLTPESVATMGIAFSVGAMLGGIFAGLCARTHTVIYAGFALSLAMSTWLANVPTFNSFLVAAAVFGFSNSASRVTFRSLAMRSIANTELATFYGMRGSLTLAMQFVSLLTMNGAIVLFSPSIVVWVYPVVFLQVIVLWGMRVKVNERVLSCGRFT